MCVRASVMHKAADKQWKETVALASSYDVQLSAPRGMSRTSLHRRHDDTECQNACDPCMAADAFSFKSSISLLSCMIRQSRLSQSRLSRHFYCAATIHNIHRKPESASLTSYEVVVRFPVGLEKNESHSTNMVWFGGLVWLSGNALASINVVVLRQTQLVPGWVTVCGWVNHLGM